MKLREFLTALKFPLLFFSSLLIIVTFLSYFLGFQIVINKSTTVSNLLLFNFFQQFDLTATANFALWFKTIFIFLNALALGMFGWTRSEKFPLNSGQKLIFKFLSIGLVFASLLETLSMYEKILQAIDLSSHFIAMKLPSLKTLPFNYYFLLLLILIIFLLLIYKLVRNLKNKERKAKTKRHLSFTLIIFILIMLMKYLDEKNLTNQINFISNLLEFLKITFLANLYFLNLNIIENFKL